MNQNYLNSSTMDVSMRLSSPHLSDQKRQHSINGKVIVLLVLVITCAFSAFCGYLPGGFIYKTTYNGINYLCNQYALNPEYRTCIVDKDNKVSGDVIIPSEIPFSLDGQEIMCKVEGIDDQAFKDCIDLTSITIPNTVWALGYRSNGLLPDGNGNWIGSNEIPEVYGVFEGCKSLKTVNIPTSVQNIGKRAFKNCTALESIVIPKSVTEIGAELFSNCSSLTSVDFSPNIENLFEETFAGCRKLKELAIPPVAKIIGPNCFLNCVSLEYIKLPMNLSNIKYSAFDGCKGVKSIYIPSEMAIEIFFPSLFESCKNLEEINIEKGNQNYSSVDGVVFNKDITSILLFPHARTGQYDIPKTVTTINERAFGYSLINSISIPNSVEEIEEEAFYHCEAFEEIEIPNSVTLIGESAFENCSYLKCIRLPESVKTIGDRAFAKCKSMTEIRIPGSVEDFGERIFAECWEIKNVYYETEHPIEADEDMFDWNVYEDAILNVPPVAIDLIKDLTPWNLFKVTSRVSEITDSLDASSQLYSIDGKKIPTDSENSLSSGIYLIRKKGNTKKIMIK